MNASDTSTGLPPRTAATLGYAGWWVTGLIFWLLERRDPFVRFHAAQSVTAFGSMALLIAALSALALVSLSFAPAAFGPLIIAAEVVTALAVVLWAVTMWRIVTGHDWRIPLADKLAEKIL